MQQVSFALPATALLPPYRRPSPLRLLIEVTVILVCIWHFTGGLRDWSPHMRVRGAEYSYLVGSGTFAAEIFSRTGAIPLWNPLIGRGEPLLENPFSFVLNPLMTVPILLFGAVQGGKVAVTLHVLLLGLGGWLLGYMLRLGGFGRVLLGLLLGGSGSVVGQIGMGFYQMSLSQTYVPWVLAGLIGTLYTRHRWTIALFVTATTLMVFAGTFWYLLPTALTALLLVGFAAVRFRRQPPFVGLVRVMLLRILLAGVFIVGLSAIRLLPQFIHRDLVNHPLEGLPEVHDITWIISLYFQPVVLPTIVPSAAIYYHYMMSPLFAGGLLLARLLVARFRVTRSSRWRILIPAVISVIIFTLWGQEGTPLMKWLYNHITFLGEWRYPGRIMAAASLWLAVIAAVYFDDVAEVISHHLTQIEAVKMWRIVRRFRLPARPIVYGGYGLLLALAVTGALTAFDTLENWRRQAGVEQVATLENDPIRYLRHSKPTEFLPVHTTSFFVYLPFYEHMVRASFGNPDYRPHGLPSTIGQNIVMEFPAEYAVGIDATHIQYWQSIGYMPINGSPLAYELPTLWYNPTVPPYSFTIPSLVAANRITPLRWEEVHPVTHYTHNIDDIHLTALDYEPNSVLVVGETAYPGWTATVDGVPAQVESVGEVLGVRLPNKPPGVPTQVSFSYQPRLLYASAAVSLLAFAAFAVYTLRLDHRIPERYRVRIAGWVEQMRQRTTHWLKTPIPAHPDDDLYPLLPAPPPAADDTRPTPVHVPERPVLTPTAKARQRTFIHKWLTREAQAARLPLLVARLFECMGYGVEFPAHAPNGSWSRVDIAAYRQNGKLQMVKIQVEADTALVDKALVGAFYDSLREGEYGVVVTLGAFTPGAREFAASHRDHLLLVDGQALTSLTLQYQPTLEVP